MSLLLLLLSIIGAIPDIIKIVQEIWQLIEKLKNRKARMQYRGRLSRLVQAHVSVHDKRFHDDANAREDLAALRDELKQEVADQTKSKPAE